MLSLIVGSKKKKIRSFIRWKLKKKWRFWRTFKFYFLRRKKNFYFLKINWLFNQKRIIWHQLSTIYGKNIKKKVYGNYKTKTLFNSKFGFILRKLEVRLNILLLRMYFVKKLLQANFLIKYRQIEVNGLFKHKHYLINVGDLITYKSNTLTKNRLISLKKKDKWNRFKRRNHKWKAKKNDKFSYIFFSLRRKNFIFNFMEINYIFFLSILLRYPLLGEISYCNKKQLLKAVLLRKIYFLY